MGVEDLNDIKSDVEREAEVSSYMENYGKTKKLIAEESGVAQINKHFQTISKPSIVTPIMKAVKEAEKIRA